MVKKKRKAPLLEAWCWYCDREFEDDKVLLQHQKAKHYRCHLCPRRLNTAGGLAVHLTQVHKAEPERLENTLPGRDTFDIEIYGMAGIPDRDLAEWKARRAAAASKAGGAGNASTHGAKRPRIEKTVLSTDALRIQLEAHKALMSGRTPAGPPPGFAPPPPSFGMPPPPVGMYARPPPPFPPPTGANGSVLPFAGPPPGFNPAAPSALPPPMAGFANPLGETAAAGMPPPLVQQQPAPHQLAVKSGAKSRLVYRDTEISPEEKLARTVKYVFRGGEEEEEEEKKGGAGEAEGQGQGQQAGQVEGEEGSGEKKEEEDGVKREEEDELKREEVVGEGEEGRGAGGIGGRGRARAADLF